MNKVVSIEFLRFFFMLQICLWHYSSCVGLMTHGYLAVEFFFILSGFLMYRSFRKNCNKLILDYVGANIKRFFPKILFAFILFGIPTFYAVILESPEKIINDLSLLSGIGFLKGSGINSPIWYISVLIVGGGLIYSSLKNFNKIATDFLFPLITLLVYTYLLNENGYSLEMWGTNNGFHLPFWRGIAGMCLGCIISKVFMLKEISFQTKFIKHLNVLFVFALMGCIYSVFSIKHYDGYVILCFIIIILSCFLQNSIINKLIFQKIWLKMGSLSLDMFILHAYVLRFIYKAENMNILQKDSVVNLLYYIPLLLVMSYLFDFTYRKYIKRYMDKFLFVQ